MSTGEKNASEEEEEFDEDGVLLEVLSSLFGDLDDGLRRRRRSGLSSQSVVVVVANDARLIAL